MTEVPPARCPDPLLDRRTLVSGGQTGADRAALDWAIAHGVPHGGWCPRGRLAEDGVIPDRYRLRETPSADYAQRTEWNIRDSDATLIVSIASELTGGSRLTRAIAERLGKPCLHVARADVDTACVRDFLVRHRVRVLNVAGPRASKEADAHASTYVFLDAVFPAAT
jgi:hypothetical protein